MRVLVDTNVLIDYWCTRKPFFEDAVKLRIAACFDDIELWASGQSFTDAEYMLSSVDNHSEVRAILEKSLAFLNIAASTATDYAEGLASDWGDIGDYLVAKCAQRVRADYLLTRNKAGFIKSNVPVMEPKEFLALLKNKYNCEYDMVNL